jgi:rubredoxin
LRRIERVLSCLATSKVNNHKGGFMQAYECPCGYIYEPEEGDIDNGIEPGTAFEDLPEEWVCPKCGAEKDAFYPAD